MSRGAGLDMSVYIFWLFLILSGVFVTFIGLVTVLAMGYAVLHLVWQNIVSLHQHTKPLHERHRNVSRDAEKDYDPLKRK